MPKLSKRKRQLKEIYTRRGDEESSSDDEQDNVKDDDNKQGKAGGNTNSKNQRNNSKTCSTSTNANSSSSSATASNNNKAEDDKVWVQCNYCEKWRSLPSSVDVDTLPEIWSCDQNIYDKTRNTCDAPEESYTQTDPHPELRSFFKLWVKRLKNADRAENRLPIAAVTRGRKRKTNCEWIRCCNPSCGKWRAVLRSMETASLLKRLSKNKKFGGDVQWYCSMNSWDDTKASCSAPQEPLYNCKWNLAAGSN